MAKLNQPQKKQEINFRTFDELIEFYNKYESFFLEFYHQTGFNLWFLIHFRLYFQYRNIQLDSLESKSNTDKSERTDKKPFFEKVVKTIRLLREVLFILFKLKKPKSYKGKKVLLSNTSDMIKGKNKRFAFMDDEFEFILNRPLFDIKQSLKNTKNRSYNLYDTDHIFMRYILKFTFVKDLKRLSIQLKSLKKNLSQAADNEEIKETTINKLIWKDVSSYYIYFMRFISFKNFFQTNKIEALLMIDENSPQQKVIQYAAKLYEIKIFAYQHGNIHLLHPAYIYKRYSTKPLLPFTTFTWGKHFTNMLKDEGGYLDEQLKTVGRIDAETNRPKSHPELENMSNIVLYASQKQRDEELRKRQLRDVIYALKENENSKPR